MAEHSRFFDSIDPLDPDKVYTAEDFVKYLGGVVTGGIVKGEGNNLKVETSGSNMNVTVDTGMAYLVDRQYENDSKLSLTHEVEALGKSRIDRVVLRLVLDMDARYIRAFVKKGVAGTVPVPPPLTRTGDVYEISLAQVKVIGGQTYINVADVTDERGQADICPWAGSNILPNFDDAALQELIENQLADGTITKSLEGLGINDLNKITNTGFYSFNTTLANIPLSVGSYGWNLMVFKTPQGQVVQIAQRTGDASAIAITEYKRAYADGVWGQWYETLTTMYLSNNLSDSSTTYVASIGAVKQVNDKFNATSPTLGLLAKADGANSLAIGVVASATATRSLAFGENAVSNNTNEAVLGIGASGSGQRTWLVPGSFRVTGTKNFEMPHPAPFKRDTHVIRHGAVESPTAGDTLYRYTIEAKSDGETVELHLPDYFQYLNKDVDVWVNGDGHFGRAFGRVKGDMLSVTCELAGSYKVLVIGTRNDDHESVQTWDIKGVEREIGESWTGETYSYEVDEMINIQEITQGVS